MYCEIGIGYSYHFAEPSGRRCGYSNDPVLANFQHYGFHAALPKPYKLSDIEEVLASVP